ncbi:hypothetical protein SH2C18_00930 [Clostridium sediminicola]|uniref:hypothetical protein n=1 Tax=Clostridium sediminicola TaxID=3114879 RepID=UPI0031F22665
MSVSHEGCSGSFDNGKQVVDKIRTMGFAKQSMPKSLQIECDDCGTEFKMEKFEGKCPECGMIFGVTPCSASSAANVKAAGKDY